MRHAWHQAQDGENASGDEECGGIAKLVAGLFGHRLGRGHTGHNDGGGER